MQLEFSFKAMTEHFVTIAESGTYKNLKRATTPKPQLLAQGSTNKLGL
jgi:hypothetical protein